MKYSFPLPLDGFLLFVGFIILLLLFLLYLVYLNDSDNETLEQHKEKEASYLLSEDEAKIIIKIYDILSNKTKWRLEYYHVNTGYCFGKWQNDEFVFFRNGYEKLKINVLTTYLGKSIKVETKNLIVNISNNDLANRLLEYGKEYKRTLYNKQIDLI